MGNKQQSKNPPTVAKTDENTQLKSQLLNLSKEYQVAIDKAAFYKESSLKNALAVNLLIRGVTSKLLDIECTDASANADILRIVKELNTVNKDNAKSS